MNNRCLNVIDCPGTDLPVMNISAEAADGQRFFAMAHRQGNVTINEPDTWCFVYSNYSQLDADTIAKLSSLLGTYWCPPAPLPDTPDPIPPDPAPVEPIIVVIWNDDVVYEDVKIPAGTLSIRITIYNPSLVDEVTAAGKDEANARALSLAIGENNLYKAAKAGWADWVFNGCVLSETSKTFTFAYGTPPLTVDIETLPIALYLNQPTANATSFEIAGFVSDAVDSTSDVWITDSRRYSYKHVISFHFIELLPASESLGILALWGTLNQSFTQQGGRAGVSFSIDPGSLNPTPYTSWTITNMPPGSDPTLARLDLTTINTPIYSRANVPVADFDHPEYNTNESAYTNSDFKVVEFTITVTTDISA